MGIKDLLKNLEGATVQKNIGDFSGKRLAVDASGWLHKAVFATAEDWVDSNCTDSQLYVDFVLTRVRNIQACGVTPIMVFDGKRNNLKSETRAKRDEGRLGNIENAKRLIESISKTADPGCRAKMRNECIACFQRGLGVTHEMEKNCMAALRKSHVDIIVAPYEADPQLAYLCHIGYCDGVMTEDSDILVYSAVCGTPFPILYKFEKSGSVQITDLKLCGVFASSESGDDPRQRDLSCNDLESLCSDGIGMADTSSSTSASTSSSSRKRKLNKDPLAPPKMGSGADGFLNQLQTYFKPARSNSSNTSGGDVNEVNIVGRRMFVQLCLLAGCDYSESVPGVGLQTAIQVVVRFKDTPNNLRLKKICDYFKLTGKRVADTYLPRILRAEQLFFYHPVFNPYSDSIAHFTPPLVSECDSIGSSGSSGESLGPAVTEVELYRLGADAADILSVSRHSSPSSSPKCLSPTAHTTSTDTNTTADPALRTIRSVCRGHVSIKDGQEIHPLYPWEAEACAQKQGNSSGWFMRRSLMQALGSAPIGGAKPLSQFRAQSVGYNSRTNSSCTNNSISNYYNNSASGSTSSGNKGMNAISSFMLANVSTTRPSGHSSGGMFGGNRFANKALNSGSGSGSGGNSVAPYHLQQQLSQHKPTMPHTNITHTTTTITKHNYFDAIELTGATQLSNVNSPKAATSSHHFSRAASAPVHTTNTASNHTSINTTSNASTFDFARYANTSSTTSNTTNTTTDHSLSTYTDDGDDTSFVYDLCQDSMSEAPDTISPPAKFARKEKSPVKASPNRVEGVCVYDVIDSPIAIKMTKTGGSSVNNSVSGQALCADLTGEAPVSPQLSFQEYLRSHKCADLTTNTASTNNTLPSKLQTLLSPASSTGSEPSAPTKKDNALSPHLHNDQDFASTLQGYACDGPGSPEVVFLDRAPTAASANSGAGSNNGANVRRKTLGAAPFVPINLNAASGSGSGDKRKIGYAAVPIARKKTTKGSNAATGTILNASIKSFFNAM